jgi:glutamine synthetase
VLRAQLAKATDKGWTALSGTELEFVVYEGSYEQAWDEDYRNLTPANRYNSDAGRPARAHAAVRAHHQLLQAHADGSFAPTTVAWGPDNRTCALRLVGHGPSLRIECRVPGGDVNPYLALAGLTAAALNGVDQKLELPPPVTGNAYPLTNLPRVPASLSEALALWISSPLAAEAFGQDVVDHYANMARVEIAAYASAVTDWELRRYFERI